MRLGGGPGSHGAGAPALSYWWRRKEDSMSSKSRVAVIAACAAITGALALTGAQIARAPRDANPAPAPIPPAEPYVLTVNDCAQDGAVLPCVTVDDSIPAWVIAWGPQRSDRLTPCPAEDGGPVLPCVWTQQQRRGTGEWIVYTDRLNVG